jgi:hypothetical protein
MVNRIQLAEPRSRIRETDAFDEPFWESESVVAYCKAKAIFDAFRRNPNSARRRPAVDPMSQRVLDERLENHRGHKRPAK